MRHIIISDNYKKNALQGIFCIEDKEIVIEPRINEEYYLYTDTIGENAIGISTKQGGSMALWTLTGIFYLLLIAFLFLKVKKNRQIKVTVFFHFGGFKNGVVIVDRGDYTEKYDKSGHLLETKWTRCSYGDNDLDYAAETWDAMTDGMYGDMPDGFDDDYSFLGH